MRRSDGAECRRSLWWVLVTGLALTSGAQIAVAQSGVVLGTGEEVLHLLDSSGQVAIDFDVDDVNVAQRVRLGRADLLGSNESDIDLMLVDSNSTLSSTDPSIFLDGSLSNINIGSGSAFEPGNYGQISIEDGLGLSVLTLTGSDGDINQVIDNSATNGYDGNGAVKAWAIVSSSGSVSRCWKCSTASGNTQRISEGVYEVDFFLGSINNRPVLATIAVTVNGPFGQTVQTDAMIQVAPRYSDSSSFYVRTRNYSGDLQDASFTIIVF